jgi:hypothetical protein
MVECWLVVAVRAAGGSYDADVGEDNVEFEARRTEVIKVISR